MSNPKFNGPRSRSRTYTRNTIRRTGIDRRKMNDGGFYEGMPGCKIDEYGNRKMLTIIVQPDGYARAYIDAHPKLCKTAVMDLCTNDPLSRSIIYAAIVENMFTYKNPFNWLIRVYYKANLRIQTIKAKRTEEEIIEKS